MEDRIRPFCFFPKLRPRPHSISFLSTGLWNLSSGLSVLFLPCTGSATFFLVFVPQGVPPPTICPPLEAWSRSDFFQRFLSSPGFSWNFSPYPVVDMVGLFPKTRGPLPPLSSDCEWPIYRLQPDIFFLALPGDESDSVIFFTPLIILLF